jgi:hypothetical protein
MSVTYYPTCDKSTSPTGRLSGRLGKPLQLAIEFISQLVTTWMGRRFEKDFIMARADPYCTAASFTSESDAAMNSASPDDFSDGQLSNSALGL